jgi:tetratricopeptide (TPR) repeat protein
VRSALAKPYRVAVLAADVALDGADHVFQREASALAWVAAIELLQRHPAVAVLDADATPLEPVDGHYAPRGANRGARCDDAVYAPSRRDELVWLEVSLAARTSSVRLHGTRAGGAAQTFEGAGRTLGDQLHNALSAWATARELGSFPRRADPASGEEVAVAVRVVAPLLVEQARLGRVAPRATTAPLAAEPDDAAVTALRLDGAAVLAELDGDDEARRKQVRLTAARLPAAWRVAALRLVELALGDDLADAILAVDPEHPQALLRASERHGEPAVLRRVLASAPCWSAAYVALAGGPPTSDADEFERVAAAAFAAVCRPGDAEVGAAVARRLADAGRTDEAVRIVAVTARDDLALELHARTGRAGAYVAAALRALAAHGAGESAAPVDPAVVAVELRVAAALAAVGRRDDAIALATRRLVDHELAWPREVRALAAWRDDARERGLATARAAGFRGDDAGAVAAFATAAPTTAADLALLLDALVALGREDEVVLAHAEHGALGGGDGGAVVRLAAACALMAAGEWRRGLDEMWRVALTEPGRDEHVALARCGIFLACAPLPVIEAALAERLAVGAPMLARRMARDVADFTPAAAKSGVVARALGKVTAVDFDAGWLAGFAQDTRSRRALDAVFADATVAKPDDELARADTLVNRWVEAVHAEVASDADLAQAACYAAGQALARYLAATTRPPSVIAGALRTVAAEALALARRLAGAVTDRDARAVLAAVDTPLRRADRWLGYAWLGSVERALALDERSRGELAGFARDLPTVASRLLGPEEAAMLAMAVARLHRDRPDGWAATCTAHAMRLAMHTGRTGADEWADAVAAQHAARQLEVDDAIDQLHVACYLAEGSSPAPCVHAARVLFGVGRAPAALAALCAGLGAATPAWRDANLAGIAEAWGGSKLDVPFPFDKVAAGVFDALSAGEHARAEKLARWAIAYDPTNAEAQRNLGLALAHQGKVADAMRHLVRGTRDQAAQVLAGVLYQAGKLADAMAVLDYASRSYTRADQWLGYAGIAYAAMDNPRTAAAYRRAHALDPASLDPGQLNAFAGVLGEVGDHAGCARIAGALLAVAGDDAMWKSSAWNHLASAALGEGRFDDAIAHAERAIAANPVAANAPAFAATLSRARARQHVAAPPLALPKQQRDPVFAQLDGGNLAAVAARLADEVERARSDWRLRRTALAAARYRDDGLRCVEVGRAARAAGFATLADTIGQVDRDAVIARALALRVREQAMFPRDPVPTATRTVAAAPAFVDRVVVPTSQITRAKDYVALLRALAALQPRDALVEFGLDEAAFEEVARAWSAAFAEDPALVEVIAAGLIERR